VKMDRFIIECSLWRVGSLETIENAPKVARLLLRQVERMTIQNALHNNAFHIILNNTSAFGPTFHSSNETQNLIKHLTKPKFTKSLHFSHSSIIPQLCSDQKTIVLSPNSPNLLEKVPLSPMNYIVGGIIDRTRRKNISLNYAIDHNLEHYRLPIIESLFVYEPESVHHQKSKNIILNINTVFTALLQKPQDLYEWKHTFTTSSSESPNHLIPKRIYKMHHIQPRD